LFLRLSPNHFLIAICGIRAKIRIILSFKSDDLSIDSVIYLHM